MVYKKFLDVVTIVVVRLMDVMMLDKYFRKKIELVSVMDYDNLVQIRVYYFSS